MTRMKAFSRWLSASIRRRQSLTISSALSFLARSWRANSSMVKGFTRIDVVGSAAESGASEQLRGLGQALEKRLQFGQTATFRIGDRRFQPVFNRHIGNRSLDCRSVRLQP